MSAFFNLFRSTLNDTSRLMALMLLTLHAMLAWGEANNLYSALFLCHYGLFLLWQPILQQGKKLSWLTIITIAGGAAFAFIYINWWATAFWIAGLFALIGGRVLSSDSARARLPNLLAAIYLLSLLLLWVVPKLLRTKEELDAARYLLTYVLPLLPLAILFLSTRGNAVAPSQNIDFFYTLLIFLLTSIVILGSFAIGVTWQVQYIKLLIYVVLGLAITLVLLSWLWNPSETFSGLELLMSRYLLSIGLPFETWLRKIAAHADYEPKAGDFLHESMREFAAFNWVSGLLWDVENAKHQVGDTSPYVSTFSFERLHLTLYSRWQLSPAMYLHVQLLTQILSEFYEAKRREETISQNTYMQTFYETGSRLTHDIKNILQSLGTLTSAAEQTIDAEGDARLIELIKRQLPRLNQRLAATLTKLEKPSIDKKSQAKVATWWKSFRQLNTHNQVQFESPAELPKDDIDPDVLDSVVDNLVQNALEKARLEANIIIKVTLLPSAHFCIEVSDTGSAVPPEVAELLFKSHVSSKNGLGVGLYHAAQQANHAGYELSLVDNLDGEVRFRLEKLADE